MNEEGVQGCVADDPASDVTNTDRALRRIPSRVNMIVVDTQTQQERATSAAFEPDDDGISVYLESVLVGAGRPLSAVKREDHNGVAGVIVRVVRSLSLDVIRDAWPADAEDPKHPRNAAHALIQGFDGMSNKQVLRLRQSLAKATEILIRPQDPPT